MKSTFVRFSDEDDEIISQGTLPVAVDVRTQHTYIIPLDEPIGPPSYYRAAVKAIQDANEGDVVRICLNSQGGRMDGCASILHALAATPATTVAEIQGDCHSAASLIALSCDIVQVGENASMLCHSARWGFMGKSEDVIQNALHNKKISDQTMRRIYKHFLSEQEINEVITGKELYLDSDEIVERLEQREEYFENKNDWPEDTLPEQLDFNQNDFYEEASELSEEAIKSLTSAPKKIPAKKVSKKKE